VRQVTEKPKEIRGRHKRESKRMPVGMAAISGRAESHEQLLDPAANACASRRMLSGPAAISRFMLGAFNQAACAAIIR
jgi:predicted MarR family transcription regulator